MKQKDGNKCSEKRTKKEQKWRGGGKNRWIKYVVRMVGKQN